MKTILQELAALIIKVMSMIFLFDNSSNKSSESGSTRAAIDSGVESTAVLIPRYRARYKYGAVTAAAPTG